MGDYTRSGGIPRLQPVGLPSKPAANGVGQRFTTARPVTVSKGNAGSKPRAMGTTGHGQRNMSTRQPAGGLGPR